MNEKDACVFDGVGISGGSALGRLFFLDRAASEEEASTPDEGDAWERLQRALSTASQELSRIEGEVLHSIGEEEARIFQIHRMLIEDEDFLDALRAETEAGATALEATERAVERFCRMLEALDDPYLSGRSKDLCDVGERIKRLLSGKEEVRPVQDEPFLLVARDLTPSQTVSLDKSRILGFVTFEGTPTSHTAILARAMGIPALIGTGEIPRLYDGETAILDADAGKLSLLPDEEELLRFSKEQKKTATEKNARKEALRALIGKPALTERGHRMLIYANVGEVDEIAPALEAGADGIGLLRSEFLYLRRSDYPTEEELFSAYRTVALRMKGKRAIIRTLDVGADKSAAYFGLPREENPALGFRAIRVSLAKEELFKTQLRAILRASAYGRLALMLPMIVSVDEVKRSRALLENCMEELRAQGERYDERLEFGIMIETPAAAVMSAELAREVDFFSVGTNDLLQYTLAADRQNPALASLCRENIEPVLRLVGASAEAIHKAGGWIGICGELAADPLLTQRFADMRIDELSVSVPYLLEVRGRVCECL